MKLEYRIGSASIEEVYMHLNDCSESFEPPLAAQLDLRLYSSKIAERATTFEAWDGERLIGLVAAYLNGEPPVNGFITNVSTSRDYVGKGVGKRLIELCLTTAAKRGFSRVGLEVRPSNSIAIGLYEKFGFQRQGIDGEKLAMECRLN